MTTREQIMAAAKQADSGFSGGPDDDGTMGEAIVGMTAIEKFFDIAFGDGAASRDVEIDGLRQQLSSLLQDLYVIKDQCGLWGGEATRAGNLLSQLLAAFVATEQQS